MTFVPSARMIAKKRNIDIASLIDILSYRRPYNSEGEETFLTTLIDTVPGMVKDEFGNRYMQIGESNVMWSCHTDSVHGPIRDGIIRQNLKWDPAGNILSLNEGKPGQCLGADDGAGVWLMLEMIKNQRPGLYVFHRGEECGGLGSHWIEKNTPELLEGIDFAIAFDRKALDSIITFQGGARCCSDAFGKSLGAAISRIEGLKMTLDTGGSFTDTAVYTDLVGECTNVSVGYYSQHGPRETLDVRHMIRLRDAMLQVDPDMDFVLERKPGDRETRWQTYNYGSWQRTPATDTSAAARMAAAHTSAWGKDDDANYAAWLENNYPNSDDNYVKELEQEKDSFFSRMLRLVKAFPDTATRLLQDMGVDMFDFADTVLVEKGHKADADLAGEFDDDEPPADCPNCHARVEADEMTDDMLCPFCFTPLTETLAEAVEKQIG